MNISTAGTIIVLFLIIVSGNVLAIDDSYAFRLKFIKESGNLDVVLQELTLTSVSDLADQELKKDSKYAYRISGETVQGIEYYEEYVVIDPRKFIGTKYDCFKVIEEEPKPDEPPVSNPVIPEPQKEIKYPKIVYNPTCAGSSSIVEVEQKVSYVNVPYTNMAGSIKVYDSSENVVADIDVSGYADYCGDYVCSDTESYLSCPLDCMEEPIPLLAEQIFRSKNSEITSNKDIYTYVVKDKCLAQAGSCVEVVGDEIYVKATDNTKIMINNNNEYVVDVDEINDASEVQIKENGGIASVTNKPFKVKGDWSQISDVKGSFQKEDGSFCNYDFDSSVTEPVTIQC